MNSSVGFVTFFGGDFIAQKIETSDSINNPKYDFRRSIYLGILGIGLNGFVLLSWYKVLDRFIGAQRGTIEILKKCFLDQLFYAPVSIFFFLSTAYYAHDLKNMEDSKVYDIKTISDPDSEFWETFLKGWIFDCFFWPFVNWIGFKHIKLHFRPSYVCIAQLMWQSFLSWYSHRKIIDKR